MSDSPQGPGWWQASDGKWYPPEQAPGGAAASGAGAGPGGAAGTLDLGTALSYGWNKFVQYIGQIIVIILIIVGIQIAFQVIWMVVRAGIDSSVLSFLLWGFFFAAGLFISFMLQAGLIRAGLAIVNGQAPEPSMLFQTDRLAPYAIASIIVSLLAFVGFFACCIGMLLVLFFTYFYGFYVIDKDAAPVDAIKASFDLVKNNMGTALLLMVVVVVLNFVTCGLASGVTFIALTYAYKTLNGEAVAA